MVGFELMMVLSRGGSVANSASPSSFSLFVKSLVEKLTK